jgi:hypothetical protein
MVDVLGLALTEQRLEEWIGQDAGVERLLKPMQCLLAAGVLKQGGHGVPTSHGMVSDASDLR